MSTADAVSAARLGGDSGRTLAQWFCLLGGAILLVRGAVGVALDPSFGTPGEGWHQLIHLVSGAALLALARTQISALTGALAFALIYAAITIVGFVHGSEVAGLVAVQTSDKVIHTTLTLISLAAAAASVRRTAY